MTRRWKNGKIHEIFPSQRRKKFIGILLTLIYGHIAFVRKSSKIRSIEIPRLHSLWMRVQINRWIEFHTFINCDKMRYCLFSTFNASVDWSLFSSRNFVTRLNVDGVMAMMIKHNSFMYVFMVSAHFNYGINNKHLINLCLHFSSLHLTSSLIQLKCGVHWNFTFHVFWNGDVHGRGQT